MSTMTWTHQEVLQHASRLGVGKDVRDAHARGLHEHVGDVRVLGEEGVGDGDDAGVVQSRESLARSVSISTDRTRHTSRLRRG
jgi:hypothetical protein